MQVEYLVQPEFDVILILRNEKTKKIEPKSVTLQNNMTVADGQRKVYESNAMQTARRMRWRV